MLIRFQLDFLIPTMNIGTIHLYFFLFNAISSDLDFSLGSQGQQNQSVLISFSSNFKPARIKLVYW